MAMRNRFAYPPKTDVLAKLQPIRTNGDNDNRIHRQGIPGIHDGLQALPIEHQNHPPQKGDGLPVHVLSPHGLRKVPDGVGENLPQDAEHRHHRDREGFGAEPLHIPTENREGPHGYCRGEIPVDALR